MKHLPKPSRPDEAGPTISVGIPVYNGERFLARAVGSVLAQTFQDWELVISDNASNDRTEEIARHYANSDPRIRYIRQERNRGVAFNWNAVLEAGRGRYFKWLSANDWLASDALESCFLVLEREPEAVLCFGGVMLVDEVTGEQNCADDQYELLDDDPVTRFTAHCMPFPKWNPLNGGLYRRDVLMLTGRHREFAASDLLLNAEMAIRGKFRRVPNVAVYEMFGANTATKFRDRRQVTTFFNPDAKRTDCLMYTRVHFAFLGMVLGAPMSLWNRLRAAWQVMRRMSWDRTRIRTELLRYLGFRRQT